MNRWMKSKRTLHFRLFTLVLGIVLVIVLLCSFILIYELYSIRLFTNSLDTIDTFNRFSATLSRFEQTFNLYTNSLNRSNLQTCYELAEELSATALEMVIEYPGEESILTNQLLVEAYITDAKNLLDESSALSEPEFWSRNSQLEQQLQQINKNARHVQYFYIQNVSMTSTHAIELWKMQLRITIFIVLLAIIAIVLLLNRFLRALTTPIMTLVSAAKQIAQGVFPQNITPYPNSSDEIVLLTNTFSYMSETITKQMNALQDQIKLSDRLHKLEMQNMNIQLSLTEKEMHLMQSMINPHFLFNCLGTVSSMAVLENAPRTQDISTKIARYLRSSIDLVGSQLTVSEELNLLNQYLYIQSIRFGKRITTRIQCSPVCETYIVPAMFLQPIVENSIVHGLRNCMHGGKIDITITPINERSFRILISDNGIGMDQKRLEHLRTTIQFPRKNSRDCIGLRSTISQLDIMFEKDYTFEIDSTPGEGTITQITLPAKTKPTENPE